MSLRLCCEYFLGGGFLHTEKVSTRTLSRPRYALPFINATLPLSLSFLPQFAPLSPPPVRLHQILGLPPFFHPIFPCRRSNTLALMTLREGDGAREHAGFESAEKKALQKWLRRATVKNWALFLCACTFVGTVRTFYTSEDNGWDYYFYF